MDLTESTTKYILLNFIELNHPDRFSRIKVLSHPTKVKYVNIMIKKGYLHKKRGENYTLTSKGREYLKKYRGQFLNGKCKADKNPIY